VKGRVQAGDRFVQDETIEQIVPGSGPISLTARVRGINAGEKSVEAICGEDSPASRVVVEQIDMTDTTGVDQFDDIFHSVDTDGGERTAAQSNEDFLDLSGYHNTVHAAPNLYRAHVFGCWRGDIEDVEPAGPIVAHIEHSVSGVDVQRV